MPYFTYRARDWQGRRRRGAVEAKNLPDALEQLHNRRYTALDVKEKSFWVGKLGEFRSFKKKKKIHTHDYMAFCRQLATMLGAGLTILKSLQVIGRQLENEEFREKLREISMEVEMGGSLLAAMEKNPQVFPTLMRSMVAAGESGGILSEVLERLAVHYERQGDLEEKIRGAMLYPMVVCIVAFIVLLIMVFFILPVFGTAFANMGVELSPLTMAVMGLGNFITGYWFVFLLLIAAGAFSLKKFLPTERGKDLLHRLMLKLPVFAPIYTKIIVSRFARNLGSLLHSGVDILFALDLGGEIIDNRIYAAALKQTRAEIAQGRTMAASLQKSGLFPSMMVEMIRVGEETGRLDEMLGTAADYYEREVTHAVNRLGIIIEPVVLILVGVMVGLLVASLVIPMFQIYETI